MNTIIYYHRTIKMKRVDIKLTTYIYFGVENNKKYPNLKLETM